MLTRDIKNKVIFGVCSGIAKELGIDPILIRLAFVVAALAGLGLPIIIYIVMAILMPKE
jgi:phage shock protein PspC (stress-responsive transcriptional regulator)